MYWGNTLTYLDMSKEKVIIPSTKLKCDKCGKYFDDSEGGMCIPYDIDGLEIEECALDEGWVKDGDKHYCPDCYMKKV